MSGLKKCPQMLAFYNGDITGVCNHKNVFNIDLSLQSFPLHSPSEL